MSVGHALRQSDAVICAAAVFAAGVNVYISVLGLADEAVAAVQLAAQLSAQLCTSTPGGITLGRCVPVSSPLDEFQ